MYWFGKKSTLVVMAILGISCLACFGCSLYFYTIDQVLTDNINALMLTGIFMGLLCLNMYVHLNNIYRIEMYKDGMVRTLTEIQKTYDLYVAVIDYNQKMAEATKVVEVDGENWKTTARRVGKTIRNEYRKLGTELSVRALSELVAVRMKQDYEVTVSPHSVKRWALINLDSDEAWLKSLSKGKYSLKNHNLNMEKSDGKA